MFYPLWDKKNHLLSTAAFPHLKSLFFKKKLLLKNVPLVTIVPLDINANLWHLGKVGEEPNHRRWHAKRKLSWNTCTLRTRLCTLGADL